MKKDDKNFNQYNSIVADSSNIELKTISDRDLHRNKNMTDQEEERDKKITYLLEYYVSNYNDKIKFNRKYKQVILWFCVGVLSIFLLGLVAFIVFISINKNIDLESIVGLISIIVSFVGLFVGVLKIITEYVFPKDEEQYITKIVEAIQKNDLENKKTDMKYMKRNNKK